MFHNNPQALMSLFFVGEELDFSYRLVNGGYKIMHSSAISVIHYETQQARVPGKWICCGVRSRCWVAIRNLPWINVLSHTLLWWGYFFVAGGQKQTYHLFHAGDKGYNHWPAESNENQIMHH